MIGSLFSRIGRVRGAAAAAALAAMFVSSAEAEPIRGAGSTFAAPIINQWSHDYETARSSGNFAAAFQSCPLCQELAGRDENGATVSQDWRVDYEPIGSLAGIMRLAQPDVDFAATDAPLPPEEVSQRGWTQFPVVMGGIAIVANVDGIGSGQLRLTGETVADIYLGKITKWSDPAIAALNPDLTLPDADIEVLHRADGSGSTFTFTSFLSESSPEWKEKLGADTLIAWPLGRAEKGTGGLVAAATAVTNSIAYLEYGQAVRAGLSFVSLRNQAGEFVLPDPEAFRAGLVAVGWDAGKHFHADTTNLPGAGAYPMAAVTYVVVPRDRGRVRIGRVLDLFRIAYGQGSDKASALGYIPVPPELADRIENYWTAQFEPAQN